MQENVIYDDGYDEYQERGKPLPLYAFFLGASITMLFKIGTDDVNNFLVNCLISFLVGVAFASGYALLEPTLALLVSAYQESKREMDEEEPTDSSSLQLAQSDDNLNTVQPPLPSHINNRLLRFPDGKVVPLTEDEEKAIDYILGKATSGEYHPRFPVTNRTKPAIEKMQKHGAITVKDNTASFTPTGRNLYQHLK